MPSARAGKRKRWPAWVTVVVSGIGIVVAVVAWGTVGSQPRMILAITGFSLVLVGGTALLFIQRVLDVGVARLSGTPLISSFDLGDKVAFTFLMIGSVANGLIIALQVARQ